MALGNWENRVNGESIIDADDVNSIANAVLEIEKDGTTPKDNTVSPSKLKKTMDFNSTETSRRVFLFREGDLRVADVENSVGAAVLHANSIVSNIADGAVTPDKLSEAYLTVEKASTSYVAKSNLSSKGMYAHDYDSATGGYVDKIIPYEPFYNRGLWKIVQSDGDGCVQVKTPISDMQATNKLYVDNAINELSSVAKGASSGLGFETVEEMNAYIETQVNASYSGTISQGDYVCISVDFGMAELDGWDGGIEEIPPNCVTIMVNNDYVVDGTSGEYYPSTKSNRVYFVWQADRDTTADALSWDIFAYNGMDVEGFNSPEYHPRMAIIESAEPTGNDIASHSIPYATSMYIHDTSVPDYWWSGSKALELETQKVDLTEYVTQSEYDALLARVEALETRMNLSETQ